MSSESKGKLESTHEKLKFIKTVLGIVLAIIALVGYCHFTNPSSKFQSTVVDSRTGNGISGVTVKLTEVDGVKVSESVTTTPEGSLIIKVEAEAGTKIRLYFEHSDYESYNDYYVTENPETIELERKQD